MRLPLLVAPLLCALALLSPASSASAAQVGLNDTLNSTMPIGATAEHLGADWIRIWGVWHGFEPADGQYSHWVGDWQKMAADAKARGLKVLLVMHQTPTWASGSMDPKAPPADPQRWAKFMGDMARMIPDVDAWEIWNEQDTARFWLGGPDAARYTQLLKASYTAIKAAQPNDLVISGGVVGNNVGFLEQMYAAGAHGYFDAYSTHTDTACLVDGPDYFYREPSGRIGRYTFTSYREIRDVMIANGDGHLPIWMTELGWSTVNTAPKSCDVGEKAGTKPAGVSEAKQAQFLTEAYKCLAADPYVQVAFWFGVQDVELGARGGHGLYRRNESAKPAVAAFKQAANGVAPDTDCGGYIDRAGPKINIISPRPGQKFANELKVKIKSSDDGVSGFRRLQLYVGGKMVRHFGEGNINDSWWGAAKLRNGTHTIEFRAEDYAGNRTVQTVEVRKVSARSLIGINTRTSLKLAAVNGADVTVRGSVKPKKAKGKKLRKFRGKPARGKATVVFERFDGAAWVQVTAKKVRARKTFKLTQTMPGAGQYRVKVRYAKKWPYRASSSKAVTFTVA